MKATKRDLIGRRIVAIDWHRHNDGRGGKVTDPFITLDNGRVLWFVTQETEYAEYGVTICISDKAKSAI